MSEWLTRDSETVHFCARTRRVAEKFVWQGERDLDLTKEQIQYIEAFIRHKRADLDMMAVLTGSPSETERRQLDAAQDDLEDIALTWVECDSCGQEARSVETEISCIHNECDGVMVVK